MHASKQNCVLILDDGHELDEDGGFGCKQGKPPKGNDCFPLLSFEIYKNWNPPKKYKYPKLIPCMFRRILEVCKTCPGNSSQQEEKTEVKQEDEEREALASGLFPCHNQSDLP